MDNMIMNVRCYGSRYPLSDIRYQLHHSKALKYFPEKLVFHLLYP